MKKQFLFIVVIAIALMAQSCNFSTPQSSETKSQKSETDSTQSETYSEQSETNSNHWTVEKLNANKKQFIDDFEITMTKADRGIKIDDILFENTEVLSEYGYPQFICTIKGSEWHTYIDTKTSPKPFKVNMFIQDRNGKIKWDEHTLRWKIWD